MTELIAAPAIEVGVDALEYQESDLTSEAAILEILQDGPVMDFVEGTTVSGYMNLIDERDPHADRQAQVIRGMVSTSFGILRDYAADPSSSPQGLNRVSHIISEEILFSHDSTHPLRAMYKAYKTARADREFRSLSGMIDRPDIQQIADIGVGAGHFSARMAQESGKEIVTTDILNFREAGKGLPFVHADALRLPFKDGQFDALFFMNVLHHMEPGLVAETIREARRVARGDGDGRVFLLESTLVTVPMIQRYTNAGKMEPIVFDAVQEQPEFRKFLEMYPDGQWKVQAFIDWWSNRVWSGIYKMPVPFGYRDLEQWEELFGQAGFELEEVRHMGFDPERVTRDNQSWLIFKTK